ncbi:toxin-antitoxin system HicB family antitoxin [Mangrovihabitans endophyticus]|uniref:HicB family protein n=1 Tax=Mangrovihabitans endophyticus TaxID=1751298 RepID=A0A8J3FPT4_9ACTN|nr:toxin-antitoxin system HicB family antitoxin [Mangrovihabitans endophyticus]GGL03931.1 hypothetical protein GCM10012284_43160 [Mangrovihabitans endophyticus]
MDVTPYVDALRADLAAAAAPGGPDTTRAAELLSHALDASARLVMIEVLTDAAAEITTRLPDASVEVRLRGRTVDLVVDSQAEVEPEPAPAAPAPPGDGGEQARLTLRMPEALKVKAEQMAAAQGVSVNAWLVRAVTSALGHHAVPDAGQAVPGPGDGFPPPRRRSSKRVTGFFEA